ncbi:hypothetical protein SBA4_6270005 [Candidatus Sulfopaludibacter sp. SbA4]|nr:hypothetical protein SBA4_6270005 [Candidatus Sulfopaludibacter sp. SbA4]
MSKTLVRSLRAIGLSGPGTTKFSKLALRYSGGICARSSIRPARPLEPQSHRFAPVTCAPSTIIKPVPPHFGQTVSVAIGSIIAPVAQAFLPVLLFNPFANQHRQECLCHPYCPASESVYPPTLVYPLKGLATT